MKALITAGGRGTRLRPLTHTQNKHVLPIANKPIIFYAIEDCVQIGIKDIIISINKGDTELPGVAGDGSRWGINITYQEQDAPLGLGFVLKIAEPLIKNDDFVFYYGDNIFTGGLKKHVQKWKKEGTNFHLCLVKVHDPERFGVALTEKNRVVTTVEKPQNFVSDLAITGIQLYDKRIFEAIKHTKPTPPKAGRAIAEMDIPPANQWLIDNGFTASYSIINGWWKDTGKPESLLSANQLVLETTKGKIEGVLNESTIEGKVQVGKGSLIENSVVRGPVVIGKDCVIKNAYIGPFTAISDSCEVTECEIENSIVLANTTIHDLTTRLDSSIIGCNTSVHSKKTKPMNLNLLIGDNCAVHIPK